MKEENAIYCDGECQRKTATELTYKFTHLPPVLVLQLKRFEFDFSFGKFRKNDKTIEIPWTLLVDCNQEERKYELFAICNHYGSCLGGHYTAFVKLQSDLSSGWYEFNDQSVWTLDKKMNENQHSLRSEFAYLLMYKRTSHAPSECESPLQEQVSPEAAQPTKYECIQGNLSENFKTMTMEQIYVETTDGHMGSKGSLPQNTVEPKVTNSSTHRN
ncbi:ubiquitin carboxyl-terminal hydrolase 19-like [Microcaecilia unicolor]|uniref:Ubiquitin carboxyl-terminal hydrolase 19-like n=1 Tax=Microcaecilia unicolor TaxID=1415580 RepID=A0A6P7ZC14_9AMPH|nr:ubiquitin carboxyl-terminal hydrolase 19-like [Microcaecilia unicolor]